MNWHKFVEFNNDKPFVKVFNDKCGSAYSFPFDDQIKLFTCKAKENSVTNYIITFCPKLLIPN